MGKYLDLAGLTAYDRMLKEWFKAGVVDIADDAIKALFVTVAEGPADNEIWYTTVDGEISPLYVADNGWEEGGFTWLDGRLLENQYKNNMGVWRLSSPITYIQGYETSKDCAPIVGADYASNLKSVVLPNSVKEIRFAAFYNCENLESVTIPVGVTSIGSEVFGGCTSLKAVYFKGTCEEWSDINVSSSCNISDKEIEVICLDGVTYIPFHVFDEEV